MMKYVRSWLLLLAGGVAVISLFALGSQPFAVGLIPPPFDKLAHAVVFGLLFVVLDHALCLPIAVTVAIPLLVSLADELHQLVLPGRQPGFDDWLAGLFGIMVALYFFRRRRA